MPADPPPCRPPAAHQRALAQRALAPPRRPAGVRRGRRAPSAPTPQAKRSDFQAAAAIFGHVDCLGPIGYSNGPSLSRGGVSAHALDHGAHAVRALRREMLLQTRRAKGTQGVEGENLLWRPIREKGDRDRDQPANEVRVAVTAIMQDQLSVGARSRLANQPYLTDAAPHFVAFIVARLAKRLESMTEFDDIAVAILPIVEGGESLEISQAILA